MDSLSENLMKKLLRRGIRRPHPNLLVAYISNLIVLDYVNRLRYVIVKSIEYDFKYAWNGMLTKIIERMIWLSYFGSATFQL